MAKKKGQRDTWKVALPVAHAIYDIASSASCPRCGGRVVLYVCPRCRRLVKPNRNGPADFLRRR